jgi:acyl-CoA synthetase (AMP-forming)/AMP-acid ligase II
LIIIIKNYFHALFWIILGMTENSCATFLTPFGATEDITCNTVGYPIPGVEAKVIDDNENAVESGEVGELCTKGFVIFQVQDLHNEHFHLKTLQS